MRSADTNYSPCHEFRFWGLVQIWHEGRFKHDPTVIGSYSACEVYWNPLVKIGDYCKIGGR
jgi:hypothetical protein